MTRTRAFPKEVALRWPALKLERFLAQCEFDVESILCAPYGESLTVADLLAPERVAGLNDYTAVCSPAPSELLATVALHNREALAARSVVCIRRNLQLLEGMLASHGGALDWSPPAAVPVAFPRSWGLAEGTGAAEPCGSMA